MRFKQAVRSVILYMIAGMWLLSSCQPGGAPLQGPSGAATQSQQTEQAAGAIATAVAEISTAGAQTATSAAASARTDLPAPTGTSAALPTPSDTAAPPTATPEAPATPSAPGTAWIVFLQDRDLALVDTAGAAPSLLSDTPYSEFLPNWSPDGARIAFLRSASLSSPGWQLMIVNADGMNLHSLDDGNQDDEWLWWIGDGSSVLVQQGNTPANTYYQVDADSGERTLIIKGVIERPVLSSDHQRALFLSASDDTCNGKGCVFPADVYLYDFTKSQLSQVTTDGEPKYGLTWSPDEASIAFQTESGPQMMVFHRVDGTLESVSQPPWWVKPWAISPDGSQVVYAQEKAVYLKGQPGSGDRQLFELPPIQDSPSAIDSIFWFPDGTGLVVGQWVALYAYTFSGNRLQQLPVYLENIYYSVRPVTGVYTPPPVPTPVAVWEPCPGAPRSQLRMGGKAQVSSDPPYPNNVRAIPAKDGDLLGKIQPGEQVEIIAGPYCSDNWVWWRVKSMKTGLEGWTAEGDASAYWLVPLP